QFGQLKRRQFITLLGGAAVPWPMAARAQQSDRKRRGGGLLLFSPGDPQSFASIRALLQGLQEWGWTHGRTPPVDSRLAVADGRNARIDYRMTGGDADRSRKYAAELIGLAPDIVLAYGASTLAPLLQATRTVPIVFVAVIDPVGGGFVSSLARPGGNATGFTTFEYGMGAKWLELLKQVAPHVTRVAVM